MEYNTMITRVWANALIVMAALQNIGGALCAVTLPRRETR